MKPLRISILLAALCVVACHHDDNAAAQSTDGTPPPDDKQVRMARAAAAGAAAGDALARSMRMQRLHPVTPTPDSAIAPERPDEPTPAPSRTRMTSDGYRDLNWLDIIPKEDVAALEDPKQQVVVRHLGNKRSKQIGTYHVIDAMNGVRAQLSGYVVPLDSDDKGQMTSFLFVPFYGACIHVPPPPPNQIIYAKLARGVPTPNIWDPFWLRGTLRAQTFKSDVAGAAYTMDDATLKPWQG